MSLRSVSLLKWATQLHPWHWDKSIICQSKSSAPLVSFIWNEHGLFMFCFTSTFNQKDMRHHFPQTFLIPCLKSDDGWHTALYEFSTGLRSEISVYSVRTPSMHLTFVGGPKYKRAMLGIYSVRYHIVDRLQNKCLFSSSLPSSQLPYKQFLRQLLFHLFIYLFLKLNNLMFFGSTACFNQFIITFIGSLKKNCPSCYHRNDNMQDHF